MFFRCFFLRFGNNVYFCRQEIAARGHELGIDYAETWSCYKGGEKHCGRCGTCVERHEAMQEAGLEDPTVYEAP